MTTMPRGQAPVYKLKSRNLPVFLDRNTPVPTRSRKIKSLKIARSREEEADGKSVTTVTATMQDKMTSRGSLLSALCSLSVDKYQTIQ